MNSFDTPVPNAENSDAIKATLKETIEINLKWESKLEKWQSKVGGAPYLPLSESYPLDSKGVPMLFLAQINFTEVPHMEGYPEEGIVQFYIDTHGDYEHKVLYFSNVETDESKLHDTMPEFDFPCGPLISSKTYSMEFSLEKQYISTWDYRFEDIIDFSRIDDMYHRYHMIHSYNEQNDSGGHRIGGYPAFTQEDPRSRFNKWKDHELLFQLDSDENIMWGDLGIATFFIKPDDLKKLDFTNILFYWDCT